MQAHAARASSVSIFDLMDGLYLVDRGHAAVVCANSGAEKLELHIVSAGQTVESDDILVLRGTTSHIAILVSQNLALNHCHPTELPVVGVDRRLLSGEPTEGQHFEKVIAKDQITGIVTALPENIGRERFMTKLHLGKVLQNSGLTDDAGLQRAQTRDEVSNTGAERMDIEEFRHCF